MQRLSLIKFFWAGQSFLRPKEVPEGMPAILAHIPLSGVARWMSAFFEETLGMAIPETRRAGQALWNYAEALSNEYLQAALEQREMPVSLAVNIKLTRLIEEFLHEFEIECRGLNIFSLSNIGTHSTSKLLGNAHANLPTDTVARLSSAVIADIDEAGRCLAFDRPTAAGFHILRAVEPLIVQYLNKLSGVVSPPSRSRSWGAYANALRSSRLSATVDLKIVGMIDHIREFYRNPIMHPEETLTSEQALSLFHTCLSAIVQLDAAIEALP